MTFSKACGLFALACAACLPAAASVHRIGLFVGEDRGLDSESPLKFASRDAREMSALFRQSGLYDPEHIIFLSNLPLDRIQEKMQAIADSLALWKKSGGQNYLFVYFSGHGDAQSLHIHGRKLLREDLVAWLSGLSCDLKIVVLDACESGDFLRNKGGRFIDDLPVTLENNLKSRGAIIVSSTSRGELAQESDVYQGAVFTHHLENGLRGLADYNGDGWIGLQESFEYARRATAMDMAMEGGLKQNPSFDLDLVGGSDPGLVPVDRAKSWMLLKNFPAGTLEIFDAVSLDRVSRLWLTGADSLSYRIPTGSYLFRFSEGGKEYLHTKSMAAVGGAVVDRKNFQERVKTGWASKGGGMKIQLVGFQTAFGAPQPFPGVTMKMGRIDRTVRRAEGKEIFSFGFGEGRLSNSATGLINSMDLYGLGYSRVYFLGGTRRLHMMGGGLAAFNLVRQRIDDRRFGGQPLETAQGREPSSTTRWANLYQLGAPFELEWAAWGRFWISGEVIYSLYGYKDHGDQGFAIRLAQEPFLKLGVNF
jgi:hypothetical protein